VYEAYATHLSVARDAGHEGPMRASLKCLKQRERERERQRPEREEREREREQREREREREAGREGEKSETEMVMRTPCERRLNV
jgi:hypothetical protein